MFAQVREKRQVFIRLKLELNGSLDELVQTVKLIFSAQKENGTDN